MTHTPSPCPDSLSILVAVRHNHLYDALAQVLRRSCPHLRLLRVTTVSEIEAGLQASPSLIIADPLALPKISDNALAYLTQHAKATPLIALLPVGIREYRDEVIRKGANAVVVADHVATDLLPAIQRLLAPGLLVNGIAEQIKERATHSAPVGEAISDALPTGASPHAVFDRAVERLAPQVNSIEISSLRPSAITEQPSRTYLRSLVLTRERCNPTNQQTIRTACNHNCGQNFCGLNVTVRDGHIVKIEPADFPDTRYRRICLKGISYVQMVSHPERLLYPLKRVGERGENRWQRISWDNAMQEIAGRLKSVAHQHGWESVMFFPYSGQISAINGISGVHLRLASILGASGNDPSRFGVDSATPSGIQDTFGEGSGYESNDFTDLVNSRLVVIWASNPVETHMGWWPFFLEAQKAGARLITIDPRRSPTAKKSDQWIGVRPGTDLYLALAILHVIVNANWIDRDFTLRHTVAPLLVHQETGRYLRAPETGNGEASTMVWDEDTQRPARVDEARTPALNGSYRIGDATYHTAYQLLSDMVQPYSPAVVAPKTGLQESVITALAEQIATVKPARIFAGYGVDRWHHGATFGRLIATIAALTGNVGIPGGGAGVGGSAGSGHFFNDSFIQPEGRVHHKINPAALPNQILTGQPNPIKAVWLAFNNWLSQWPDRSRLLDDVLPQLELIVVAEHFMTDTAQYADYVLPAAMLFEREDMVKGPGPYIQYQPQLIEPPGECRSDFDMMADLARLLGAGAYFDQTPAQYLAQILASEDDCVGRITFDMLQREGVLQADDLAPENMIAHHDHQFTTPTGRVEFYVERLLTYEHPLPDYEPPIEADLNSSVARSFPLVCLTQHNRFRVHSTFVKAPWLREIDQEPLALIHPDVAEQRQIANGDWVRIFNTRGHVVLRAHLSTEIPREAVYLSQGWQSSDFPTGHPQSLTHNRVNLANSLGPNSSYSDVLVEVVREDHSDQNGKHNG